MAEKEYMQKKLDRFKQYLRIQKTEEYTKKVINDNSIVDKIDSDIAISNQAILSLTLSERLGNQVLKLMYKEYEGQDKYFKITLLDSDGLHELYKREITFGTETTIKDVIAGQENRLIKQLQLRDYITQYSKGELTVIPEEFPEKDETSSYQSKKVITTIETNGKKKKWRK